MWCVEKNRWMNLIRRYRLIVENTDDDNSPSQLHAFSLCCIILFPYVLQFGTHYVHRSILMFQTKLSATTGQLIYFFLAISA